MRVGRSHSSGSLVTIYCVVENVVGALVNVEMQFTRQMLKHVGASLSCYTCFQVRCPIQVAQKPTTIMYQQWLLLGLLTQGM